MPWRSAQRRHHDPRPTESLAYASPSGPTKREIESRAFVASGLCPNPSAMPGDHALHGRKTDAGPWKFRLAVQPLKWREQAAGVGHVESGAIITHKKHPGVVATLATDLDAGAGRFCGKFPGVSKQVFEHHGQKPRIRIDDHTV